MLTPNVRLAGLLALCLSVSACAGNRMSAINAQQCPPVDILATADILKTGDGQAELTAASLTCFIDKKQDNRLLAQVTLRGTAAKGAQVPVFVAALDRNDEIIARAQYRLTARDTAFSLQLPHMDYGQKGDDRRPRLVAGFVLSDAQLADNRKAYRKSLGLRSEADARAGD